jgi:hypothetical protein
MRPLVEALYHFDSGHGQKAISPNRKLAEELKRKRGFMYKVSIEILLSITNTIDLNV